MGVGRAVRVVTAGALLALLAPGGAAASTARHTTGELPPWDDCGSRPTTVEFLAHPGEVNRLTISDETTTVLIEDPFGLSHCSGFEADVGVIVLHDSSNAITAVAPCVNVIGRTVRCSASTYVRVDLGDRDDNLALATRVNFRGMTIEAGDGNDSLRTVSNAVDDVSCGPGNDTVVADARDVIAASCENVTVVP